MKFLYAGIILSIIGVLLSIVIWGMDQAYLISGGLAAIFIGLSMLTSGALVNGDSMRANFATETKEDRHDRRNMTTMFLLLGLPNLGIALLFYYL